ncbi:MAG: alpha-hydroxy-acid oxidizing protein [Thermoplasmata archaeon]|nr:alpha-hydroxy-acid oxidizing protein [Thermoplasmata archaeon]
MPDPSVPSEFRTLADLERVAESRVPGAIWDYIQGGAGEERTLQANREAFRRRTLRPRVLVDVSALDPTTSMLGTPVRAPYYVAPTAYQGQIHPDGERGTARAAAGAGVLAMFSTLSSTSLEAIAEASGPGPRWFQLYLQPEFARTRQLVERAERAGYSAIVLTADVPMLAVRDRQAREGFALDAPVELGNGPEFVMPPRVASREGAVFRLRPEAAVGWPIIDRLREVTELPIVVKGILRPDDAHRAVEHGARAIVVSNHGGRQLDGAPAALDVLPEIVAAVGTRAEVYLDGGVRRASDVLLALALGARAVGIGRPVLWALAVGGAEGVARYLSLLEAELVNVMALCGTAKLADVDRSLLG